MPDSTATPIKFNLLISSSICPSFSPNQIQKPLMTLSPDLYLIGHCLFPFASKIFKPQGNDQITLPSRPYSQPLMNKNPSVLSCMRDILVTLRGKIS